MSDPAAEGPHVEVHSDEDWKERVKNEDRARDAQRATEQVAPPPDKVDAFGKLPRAEFSVLVQIFVTQAMAALGLLPDPSGEPPTRRMSLAKHFIDLLGVLDDKTRGNLTPDEDRLLSTSLHELRLVYVDLSKQPGSGPV